MDKAFDNYENRDQLYKYLIEDFGFIKKEENYSPKYFGDFNIVLSSNDFLVRYVKSKSFLTLEIASHYDSSNWYDLGFIKNYTNHTEDINPNNLGSQVIYSKQRLDDLNDFLKNNYDLISDLLNRENYENTRAKIDELLKQSFDNRYPGARDNLI
jgi:hypothetical protein